MPFPALCNRWTIVRQSLRTVEGFAAEHDVSDIREVVVDCGELSLVIPWVILLLCPDSSSHIV
ncbi:MAG: hypothetical protein IJV40_05770 [Oscillospiraceae bacterium]|nr:hypothetical protein [Oscillospiraceae bacterium]